MTQPTEDPQPRSASATAPVGDPALLERLRKTSEREVAQGSKAVGHFSKDDEESEDRSTRSKTRKAIAKLKTWFYHFLFGLACFVITILTFAYIGLVGLWVYGLIFSSPVKDPGALKGFIDSVLFSMLIIFATLFFENVFKNKE